MLSEPSAEPATAPPDEKSEFSDFLSELRQEVEEEVTSPSPGAGAAEQEDLKEIFQEFQKGLKEQLGEEDFETHYNLGIAYKEMELVEEALGEFLLAEKSPQRHLDSLSMIAICLLELGREDEAEQKLRQGIDSAVTGSDEHKGLLYDLADLARRRGREEESQEHFGELWRMDSSYRDVAARAGAGKAPRGLGPDTSDTISPSSRESGKKGKVSFL